VGIIAAFIILLILPPFLSEYWLTILTQMLIYGILAMSLDILMGYTGVPSFGHCAYFGASAYVIAILSTRYQVGLLGCVTSSLLTSVVIASIFGLLVAHTAGVYFLMITLALGMTIWGLAYRWVSMTGGDNGIAGIPTPELGLPISLDEPLVFYFAVLLVFLAAFLLLYIFTRSPFGQSLLGIRESESRMRILGYNTWLHKYLAYIVAGAFGGLSGMLVFLMVILGGPGTLIGPAVGAGIIVFLKNFISAYTHRWLLIIGSLYILLIWFAPGGMKELVTLFVKGGDKET
jgi:branched-chain amino acid transport system permease protein